MGHVSDFGSQATNLRSKFPVLGFHQMSLLPTVFDVCLLSLEPLLHAPMFDGVHKPALLSAVDPVDNPLREGGVVLRLGAGLPFGHLLVAFEVHHCAPVGVRLLLLSKRLALFRRQSLTDFSLTVSLANECWVRAGRQVVVQLMAY